MPALQNPECVKVCPAEASHIAADCTIQTDKSKCIGCQFCVMACPYNVRYLNEAERLSRNARSARRKPPKASFLNASRNAADAPFSSAT